MEGALYSPEMQGRGVFDGGKIVEAKPIGFTGEGSAVTRVGPLFYWSWFHSPLDGYTGRHPHQGFEIITYMIQGKAVHSDSLGTHSEVEAGGLQLMRTGSGLQHEERFVGPDAEGLQVWFEPHLRDALKLNPSYRLYSRRDFHMESSDGVICKTVIGDRSPADLTVDVRMFDIQLQAGKEMPYTLEKGRLLAALAVRGTGSWSGRQEDGEGVEKLDFRYRDFMVIRAGSEETFLLSASEPLRMILIDVRENPGYPLYPKRP